MTQKNIFTASTEGNLNRVKYLIEVERINVNSQDDVIK